MSLRNLQNALRDLDRVTIRLELGPGSGQVGVRDSVGLGLKFANCACAILKLRSAFCKLRRLTNRAQ